MSKNHDENKDIRLISRIAKVDYANKTIQAPKSSTIGIRTWGRIDFLTNYRGWSFVWNNSVKVNAKYSKSYEESDDKRKRNAKKVTKENTFIKKKKR